MKFWMAVMALFKTAAGKAHFWRLIMASQLLHIALVIFALVLKSSAQYGG